MDFISNSIPQWVSVLFLIAFIVPIFMIRGVVRQGALHAGLAPATIMRLTSGVVAFYLLFYAYVAAMSFTGIFQKNTLPPKILLFTAVPLLLFYFGIVFRSKLFWVILQNVHLSSLVRLHIFRLVGIFFIIFWAYGALPQYFAFVAGFGDIFAAVTAIFVANLVDKKARHYKKITLIWNIVGFWDIVNVVITAVYVTKQAIDTGGRGVLEMAYFPTSLIPAFAPATIIFLHICIFKKLKMDE
jgi:hypothetical protein